MEPHGTPLPYLFPGFTVPAYTPVPDILFDELLAILTGAEVKVLLYIIRRTFGFKKQADSISLQQLQFGITKKDGTVLDNGCGVKNKNTLLQAIRSLEEKHIIIAQRQRSAIRGDMPTVYSLNMASSPPPPVVSNLHPPVVSNLHPPVVSKASHTINSKQYTEEQQQPSPAEPMPAELTHSPVVVVASSPTERPERPKPTDEQPTVEVSEATGSVLNDLVNAGITKQVALGLLKSYPHDAIRTQIAALPHRKAEDPGAVLVKAIKEDWALPKRFTQQKAREEKIRQTALAIQPTVNAETKAKEEKVHGYLAQLTPDERVEIERLAEAKLREGGFFRNLRQIPEIMRESYVALIASERMEIGRG
jgi:hypothetical protein